MVRISPVSPCKPEICIADDVKRQCIAKLSWYVSITIGPCQILSPPRKAQNRNPGILWRTRTRTLSHFERESCSRIWEQSTRYAHIKEKMSARARRDYYHFLPRSTRDGDEHELGIMEKWERNGRSHAESRRDWHICVQNEQREKENENRGKWKKLRMREVINPDFWFRIMRAVQKIAKIVLHFFF